MDDGIRTPAFEKSPQLSHALSFSALNRFYRTAERRHMTSKVSTLEHSGFPERVQSSRGKPGIWRS